MPLETGVWTANVNGLVGQLNISSVDTLGNLSGTIFVQSILSTQTMNIQGFWNETSQEITFKEVLGIMVMVYKGFLFQDRLRITGVTGSVVFRLAGYCEAFEVISVGLINATSRRHRFGWYAQIGVG